MDQNKRPLFSDVLVVGFAMFATFFGAGNMIFPPYLGHQSGSGWWIGFLCFILADAGLAIMTVLVMIRGDGTIWYSFKRLGKWPMYLVVVTTMTIVGPALCIPRTCATTYEMGVVPFFPNFSPWVFGIAFFAVVYVLILHRSRVVDIIGKYMTPILLISLTILVVKGMITPLGEIGVSQPVLTLVKEGFSAGYQTMDVLGALAFTMIVIRTVHRKGYDRHEGTVSIVSRASVVAVAGLFVVYGGLTYLGATTSTLELGAFNQTSLVVTITQRLLGNVGKGLLAVMVLLACMTTAVGLASACCNFFYALMGKKIPYRRVVLVVCIISLVISIVGISPMIALATPILNVLYPLLLTQIVLSFFGEKIKKNSIFQGAAIGALVVCILGVAADFGAPTDFVHHLPLFSLGLYWMLPAALGGVIGAVIPRKTA